MVFSELTINRSGKAAARLKWYSSFNSGVPNVSVAESSGVRFEP